MIQSVGQRGAILFSWGEWHLTIRMSRKRSNSGVVRIIAVGGGRAGFRTARLRDLDD